VARRAGVSTMTVSRVVNKSGYASGETRARVEQAIGALGYVPNALARHFRSKRTHTVALVLSDITNPASLATLSVTSKFSLAAPTGRQARGSSPCDGLGND
jgi:DNA-binding LacI/PurR family transcriptional regulator